MDSAPSLDTVYQAVMILYRDPDGSKKEIASRWLQQLQESVFSWKIADEMLHEKKDLESCYFAAQTLRSKIQLSFHELPAEAHESLRDSLLQHIGQVNISTNVVIVTQLCLALADLALQMASWKKPVLDLLKKFSSVNVWPLLEILTVLPEEVNSRNLRLGANRREEIKEDLNATACTVSDFLKICLSSGGDSQIHTRLLRCYTSWVSIRAITLPDVADNVIISHAFRILSNHKASSPLHEAATDCICCLLQCLEDNNNQPELEKELFTNVMALEEAYHLSVAHEDQEKSMNYCRIFTELGESFLEKILNQSVMEVHFAIRICDVVLICVGHHDYEVAEITFNLWFRISEGLYQKNNEAATTLFKPYVERLIAALCKHCQMEPDNASEGLVDDGDDFADFRAKVSELIKDVVFIVGSSNCFRQMFLSLQQPGVTWDSTEAALFIMQAVAKNILPQESEVVPKVVEAILGLPENTHFAVRHTSVQLLGELCEWIEKHPQTLEPILNFLLYCLQQPQIATVAANSLQSVCSACKNHMGVHFQGLVQIVQSLDSFTLSNDAAIGLLKGISLIVGKLPHDQINDAMRDICWCQITPLCTLMENNVIGDRGSKTDPCLWLDRLAAIFRSIDPRVENGSAHPCLGVITEVWPIMSNACTKYQSDLRVSERICRCLRFAVRCVSKQIAHLLPSMIEQMIELYYNYRFSCYLYLGSILTDEYAADSRCHDDLHKMLRAFMGPTFALLQEPNGLTNHPDTVDDFFRLCARFIQRAPFVLLQKEIITPILQCAILAIHLDHRDASSSVMKFFYDLIHIGYSHQERTDFETRNAIVTEILEQNGQLIVTALIHACVFKLHSFMFTDVVDVIDQLVHYSPMMRQLWAHWLQTAIEALPIGNSRQATCEQLIRFNAELSSATEPKVMSRTIRDFVRLYR